MSKTSFLSYTDERLTGFMPATANDAERQLERRHPLVAAHRLPA